MYPHPYHMMGWRSAAPRRFVWFIIGAVSATWWIKRKDMDQRTFGFCHRPQLPASPSEDGTAIPSPIQGQAQAQRPPWGHFSQRGRSGPPQDATPAHVQAQTDTRTGIPSGANTPWGAAASWESNHWDQEREHFAKISQQATDAMTDVTEAALETVLSTAETLKAKLAEHKAQREKDQKIIEQKLEEERKKPARWV